MIEVRPFRPEKIQKPRGFVAPSFSGVSPLDLEIGCGVGWHPIRYASENPERTLVAIEHTRTRFLSFERRLEKHPKLRNLFPIHADAVAWVTHALAADSIDRVFLMYPNPYPKKVDLNKRWHAMPFMNRLLQALRRSGELFLATNERWYFDEAREYFESVWKMREVEAFEFDRTRIPGGSPRTHFEKKYLGRGESCYQLRVRKVGSVSEK